MQVINVPVNVLLYLRIPDRDIHRYIIVNGNATANELKERLNISRGEIDRALYRLNRLGLVKSCQISTNRGLGKSRNIWYVVSLPKASCIVRSNGRVTLPKLKFKCA